MKPTRRRIYSTTAANPPASVPDAQARALDRRHALNDQQRNFSRPASEPYHFRPRPPG